MNKKNNNLVFYHQINKTIYNPIYSKSIIIQIIIILQQLTIIYIIILIHRKSNHLQE